MKSMEVIKINRIVSSLISVEDDSYGVIVTGRYFRMEIVDKDEHKRFVSMLFDNGGKRIIANDYQNKVQFRFLDESKEIEHCKEGETIEVDVSKFLGGYYSAALLINA